MVGDGGTGHRVLLPGKRGGLGTPATDSERVKKKKNTMTTMMTDGRSRIGDIVVSATAAENGSDRHACLGMLRWIRTIDSHLLDEKLSVHSTTRVHLHLLHLIRI